MYLGQLQESLIFSSKKIPKSKKIPSHGEIPQNRSWNRFPLTINKDVKPWRKNYPESEVHSCRTFISKDLINIWKKRKQMKTRITYSWKLNQKEYIFSNGNVFLLRLLSIHFASFREKGQCSPSQIADFFKSCVSFSLTKDFFEKLAILLCLMLLTLYFFTPKMSVFLKSWGERVTWTNELIDCSLKTKSNTHPKFSVMFWLWN